MATLKIYLKFSGAKDECPTEFLQKLSYLKLANDWTDDQYFGNCLVSLSGAAFRFYNQEVKKDPNIFKSKNESCSFVNSPDKLFTALKEEFKPQDSFSDILTRCMTDKQQSSESINDSLQKILRHTDLPDFLVNNRPSTLIENIFIRGLCVEHFTFPYYRIDPESDF